MKHTNQHCIPKKSFVTSALGELVVRSMKHGGLLISRKSGQLFRDGKSKFESYIVTGSDNLEMNTTGIGLVGIGRKRATFFCDRSTSTEVRRRIIAAAISVSIYRAEMS